MALAMKTPVETCLDDAAYTICMLSKYPENTVLVELGQRLTAGRTELAQAARVVEDAEETLLVARVEVKFEDHASDEWLRRLHNQAQAADGHKGGRVSTTVFPDGLSEITRRQGPAQIKLMRDVEGRLEHMTDWPDAPGQHAALIVRRTGYEAALQARSAAERQAKDARTARDAVKGRFLDLYAEIAGRIQAEFPRNRRMQELFFDTSRTRRRPRVGGPGETPPGEPEPGEAGGAV